MTEIERMQAYSYLDGAAAGLKEARNDVIEELEKINNKIDSYYYTNDPDELEIQYNLALADIQLYINKRISELKGENE